MGSTSRTTDWLCFGRRVNSDQRTSDTYAVWVVDGSLTPTPNNHRPLNGFWQSFHETLVLPAGVFNSEPSDRWCAWSDAFYAYISEIFSQLAPANRSSSNGRISTRTCGAAAILAPSAPPSDFALPALPRTLALHSLLLVAARRNGRQAKPAATSTAAAAAAVPTKGAVERVAQGAVLEEGLLRSCHCHHQYERKASRGR